MLFQHFVTDDFRQHENLLNKKINLEDLIVMIDSLDCELSIGEDVTDDIRRFYISSKNANQMAIHGHSFNKIDRPRRYNSFKTWLDEGGFPIVCNIVELREEYPNLDMLSDTQLALFTYAVMYPNEPVNNIFKFNTDVDYIKLFELGFNEYGVQDDFDNKRITLSKLMYLIEQGRIIDKDNQLGK